MKKEHSEYWNYAGLIIGIIGTLLMAWAAVVPGEPTQLDLNCVTKISSSVSTGVFRGDFLDEKCGPHLNVIVIGLILVISGAIIQLIPAVLGFGTWLGHKYKVLKKQYRIARTK